MQCEFEEKQFEQLLNNELIGRRPLLYPAGQILEHIIGIDSAVYSKNRKFWNLWANNEMNCFNWWRRGLYLEPWLWDRLEDEINMFPKFKVNVFIQHKRPEYMYYRSSKEWGNWNSSYYRFNIDAYQQGILFDLEEKTSKNAIVVYACPAFWERKLLWEYGQKRKIIENSNFVEPHNLQNHYRYTFISGGNVGIACSEPSKIEGIDLLNEFDRRMQSQRKEERNIDFIYKLSDSIYEVVKEYKEYKEVIGFTDNYKHRLATAFSRIFTFLLYSNSSWGIGYMD